MFHMSKSSKQTTLFHAFHVSKLHKMLQWAQLQPNEQSFKHTICSNIKIQMNTVTLMSTFMNTAPQMFHLVSLHGLHFQWRVPPGWDTLCRLGRSPWCGRCSTWGTWGTGHNVLPLQWWGWFLQCCCSWFACWKGLQSQFREYCLETPRVAGGPVFWGVPLMALSLQFGSRI